ncbi:hypothetical protein KP509_19G053800 [Ceratopteris richardii]|nr:hypothetical protein KP509_19G053800 [Ceratopteris richardii]
MSSLRSPNSLIRSTRGMAPSPHNSTANPAQDQAEAAGLNGSRRISLLSSGFWVSMELFFTLAQILAAIVILAISQNERSDGPLPIWVIGYAAGCSASLPLLYWRYHHPAFHRFDAYGDQRHENIPLAQNQRSPATIQHQSTVWLPSMPVHNAAHSAVTVHFDAGYDSSENRPFSGINQVRIEMCMERLRMTVDCFFAVWFVLGNVWVFGRPSAAQGSPKLYRLCVAFLALSCISYAMPFMVCAVVCCCLPCFMWLLGFGEGSMAQAERHRGASVDTIAALPIFRFKKRLNVGSKHSANSRSSSYSNDGSSDTESSSLDGGVLVGPGDNHFERSIVGEDAACCICLGRYRDNAQLRGLPCSHHFHSECLDQWLRINACCPLCKLCVEGGKSDDRSNERNGSFAPVFEEV